MPDDLLAKPAALDLLDQAYARLLRIVRPIDDAHGTWQGAFGAWSVVNVLQHVDGWLREMAPPVEQLARGERPAMPQVDAANVDAWNAKFVDRRGAQSMAQAIAALETGHTAFRRALDAMPAERFATSKSANFIAAASGYRHYTTHADEIEAWLGGSHA